MSECVGCGAKCTVECGSSCSGTVSAHTITRANRINIPTSKSVTINNNIQKTIVVNKKKR